ncbi:efflux RND transporter periplasmic adaptor subunit [Bacillus atrophaeus]|uniref:efflux RND transporter periplasmic adaptor subunit n=1 Tax=Bacillus atrophaeus TaxID=1452 RepID=UPI002E22158C|nr:efflux RND transporter periplasmic adaptor subunit [Bacillus atrophaeus]MED4858125.1 efflux RND transporter periplasmic adaptor subunit [Bacillus atrophaeus]
MSKKKKWLIFSLIFAGVLVLAGVGFGAVYFFTHAKSVGGAEEPYAQSVSMFMGEETASANSFSGKVEPEKQQKVYIDSEKGSIKKTYVKEGDKVKKGDKLFEYDTADNSDEVEQSNLDIEMANLQINRLEKTIADTEKKLKKADKEEKSQLEDELDQARFDLKTSNLELKQHQKELANLTKSKGSNVITSKHDGIVQTVNQDIADGASGDQASGPYIQIVSTGAYLVKSQVNELLMDTIKKGSKVKITLKTGGEGEWTGKITDIGKLPAGTEEDGQAESYGEEEMNPQSSNYPFTILLDSHKGLEVGYHVNIDGLGDDTNSDSVKLPSDMIVQDDGEPYVWKTDEEQKAVKQTVEIGEPDENDMVEIKSGLTPEDYVIYPDLPIKEGEQVTVDADTE